MKRWLLTVVALAALLLNAGLALADDDEHDDMDHATPSATPAAMATGGAYLTITNDGDEDDRLVKVESPVAEVVEIHEVVDDNGIMRMRPLEHGLEVDGGETVELEPGGYHLMMIGLKHDLEPGMVIDVTLTFEKAGEVVVSAIVRGDVEAGMAATPMPPVTIGDLTISGAWARPASAMVSDHDMHGDMATPTATHGH